MPGPWAGAGVDTPGRVCEARAVGLLCLVLCLVLTVGGCARPAVGPGVPEAPRLDGREPVVEKVLDNGLRVLVQPEAGAPVVAIQVWVGVGSADEGPGEHGLAHLHEHMMFKGTGRRGEGEIAASVEAAGGDVNAWTSYDETVYHMVLGSGRLDEGLEIMADALLGSTFTADALASELEVVLDELRRTRDLPSQVITNLLFGEAFREHPYGHPIVGDPESVEGFTRDRLLAFHRRWYVPANMVLVVAGELDVDHTLDLVDELFGRPAQGGRPTRTRPMEPRQTSLRVAVERDLLSEAHVALGFHVPGLTHPDVPALDLLTTVLGDGDAARLERGVRRRLGLVTDVYSYTFTPKDPGLLVVGAAMPPDKLEPALAALLRELFELRAGEVGEEELARAKRLIRTDLVYQRETVEGQARKLGYYQTVANDVRFEERYYQAVERLTPGDLARVAETYLTPDNLTVALILPSGPGGPAIDRERVAGIVSRAAEEVRERHRPVALPAPVEGVYRVELANGMVLLIMPDHQVPVVAVRGVCLGGSRAEDDSTRGINHLVARMLTRGTSTMSGEEIARRFDDIGGAGGGFSGRNTLGLAATFLAGHMEEGLDLVADCLLDPAFPEPELARERSLVLEELQARDDNPSSVVFRAFYETLFGNHPYSHDVMGERQSVEGLTREDLAAYYRSHCTPGGLVLAVVGDVDPQRVADQVNLRMGHEPAGSRAQRQPMSWPPPEGRRVKVVFKERHQAHVVLGFPGTTLDGPDRFALDVLATVLGSQGGRLFVELRDRRGLAYSIGAVTLEGVDPGYVAVYLATDPSRLEDAIQGVLQELERVTRGEITEEEVARAKEYLVGTHAMGMQRRSERAAAIALDEIYGLGFDAHLHYPERIHRVTRDEVLAVAKRYLLLDRYVLAVVRPKEPGGGLLE